jgi:hypothetical protein
MSYWISAINKSLQSLDLSGTEWDVIVACVDKFASDLLPGYGAARLIPQGDPDFWVDGRVARGIAVRLGEKWQSGEVTDYVHFYQEKELALHAVKPETVWRFIDWLGSSRGFQRALSPSGRWRPFFGPPDPGS